MPEVYGIYGNNKCKREVIPMGNIVTFEVHAPELPSGSVKVNWPEELKNKGFSANIIPISVVLRAETSASIDWIYPACTVGVTDWLTLFDIINVTDSYFNFQYQLRDTVIDATFYVTFLVTNIHSA